MTTTTVNDRVVVGTAVFVVVAVCVLCSPLFLMK
eukprot:CAMPEP_0170800856 /NCGR_PEP_ID=MMETSP0733-20121128/28128_1 /TAXON_ID=186038 /ORGANISM="Fragilariopsis kerguelensis, Strain L26-C5" /LENGTH=33 /DNA_ID= /DNA_START= /DNA_END= /DNA_ORIENTATION=